jgi:hypothetical protein
MSGCEGCPPFADHPCGFRLDTTGSWTETSGSFTAEKSPPTLSVAPIGTLLSSSAMPGLLDVLYHADHLLASYSLPYTSRREDAVYDFELAPVSGFDPDEFQIRGHIAARVDWTIPASPIVGSAQVIVNARVRFVVQSGGYPLVSLDMNHTRTVGVVTGGVWGPVTDTIASELRDNGTPTIAAIPRQEGNFVIDRSVSRGTTQLWFDNVLIIEPTPTISAVPGALDLSVDFADVHAQVITVDVPMVEAELELSGLRICPSGSAISDVHPLRYQAVRNELVGYGDGVTLVYATEFAYVASSLQVEVSGIATVGIDFTTPARGLFTLIDPAPVSAPITASYQASGL